MSKRWWFLSAALLLIFLLVQLPARFVLQGAVPPNASIRLHNINGSVWQGRSDIVTPKLTLHNVQWSISPWQLLLARVQAVIAVDDGDVQASGVVRVGLSGSVSLREGLFNIPANKLDVFLPMRGLQMQGSVQAQVNDVQWQSQQLQQLDAQINWQEAYVKTPLGTTELGAYRVDLKQNESGAIVGNINDLGGVLDLQGQLTLVNHQLSMNGSVKRELPEHVSRFFKMFARDNGRRLEFTFDRELSGAGN